MVELCRAGIFNYIVIFHLLLDFPIVRRKMGGNGFLKGFHTSEKILMFSWQEYTVVTDTTRR